MTVETPEYSGCSWPIDESCLPEEWDEASPEIKDWAIALASQTLRRLTAYRVGGCPIIVRPCKASCVNDAFIPFYGALGTLGGGSFRPGMNAQGAWINSCGCSHNCSCTTLCTVNLPGPVGAVMEVRLDGVLVPQADYFVSGNAIVWAGEGDCPWPTCQDLSKPNTEVGTFSVTYLNSYAVDGLGAHAAATLAAEFAASCTGGTCRLPSSVTAVTRQGVTYEITPGSFPDGFTGIQVIDAYISLWNPRGLKDQPRVWTPQMRSPQVQRTGSITYDGGSP